MKKISRKQFNEMTGLQAAQFFADGGSVYDEPDPKDAEIITSHISGSTCSRAEWERMSTDARCKWLYGDQG